MNIIAGGAFFARGAFFAGGAVFAKGAFFCRRPVFVGQSILKAHLFEWLIKCDRIFKIMVV